MEPLNRVEKYPLSCVSNDTGVLCPALTSASAFGRFPIVTLASHHDANHVAEELPNGVGQWEHAPRVPASHGAVGVGHA